MVQLATQATARAVSNLAETGPPSWKTDTYTKAYDDWPNSIPNACKPVLNNLPSNTDDGTRAELTRWLPRYTELSILRAAYFTIMMRAAHNIGPGLEEDPRVDTALLYMA